ncbi:MAG: TolB family protein, partial [Chitinophagales bacterium]
MKTISVIFSLLSVINTLYAQQAMTPEMLWSVGRVSSEIITPDGESIIYGVTYYNKEVNKGERNLYSVSVNGGTPAKLTNSAGTEYNVLTLPNGKMGYLLNGQIWQAEWDGSNAVKITNDANGLDNVQFSPNGKLIAFTREVKTSANVHDLHPDLPKANAYIIDDLMYRHWDTWSDNLSTHIFFALWDNGKILNEWDIMADEPFDCPTKPFGGLEDFCWSPDSKSIIYVCKKMSGKEYALSTNKDIYAFNLQTAQTKNLTT